MGHNRFADLRRRWKRVIAPLMLGLVVACAPSLNDGCEPLPATDASSPTISLDHGSEAVRGTDPHLIFRFDCPGKSNVFLAAIKVDGVLRSMHEVQCTQSGSQVVTCDAGHWEPPDTVWHSVEVILDPLNLFKETSESNNRGSAMLRIVEPNGTTPAVSGPASRGRR